MYFTNLCISPSIYSIKFIALLFIIATESTFTEDPMISCACDAEKLKDTSICQIFNNRSVCIGKLCFRSWYAFKEVDKTGKLVEIIASTDGCLNYSSSSALQQALFCGSYQNGEPTQCCDENYCNFHLKPSKEDIAMMKIRFKEDDVSLYANGGYAIIGFCVAFTVIFTLIMSIIIRKLWRQIATKKKDMKFAKFWYSFKQRRHKSLSFSLPSKHTSSQSKWLIEDYSGSGSGSGLPLLVERTLARQIHLVDIIGKGRFGEVWRGLWHDEFVAVKIFSARDERSWFRETEIYQTALNRHLNILGFIAADNKDTGSWTQLWLVTDHHQHGSLYDYLIENSVSLISALKMIYTIATGLNHLHMPIEGYEWKPAIAHRDLKSKNILVKSDLSCCIADFGLAVKHDTRTNKMNIMANSKAGTNRYMSPEGLDGRLNECSFEAFKQADVYSFSLVVWEICRRIDDLFTNNSKVLLYALPYYEYVRNDPTIEEMHKVICIDGKRPTILPEWNDNIHLNEVVKLLEECWYDDPSARLSALRIKKSFGQIYDTADSSNNNLI